MLDLIANSLSIAPIAAAALLPGYLWRQSERNFVASARLGKIEEIYGYVLYSLVAYSLVGLSLQLCGWLPENLDTISLLQSVRLLVIAMVVSYLGGIATGLVRRFNLVGVIFGVIGIPTIHPIEKGWDKAFSRRDGCLVRVTFKNGKDRFGIYGAKSLVSAEIENGDIYLEKTLCQGEGGLVHENATEGIWISSSEVQCLRFYKYEELENDIKSE